MLTPDISALLSRIQAIDPTAHIGGGYLRDTYFSRPIKDVDVFANVEHVDALTNELRKTHPQVTETIPVGEAERYETFDASVAGVIEFAGFRRLHVSSPTPVNLILRSDGLSIAENLARFDFGICRIAHDGTNLIVAPEFDADRMTRCFTLCKCENADQYVQSMRRYSRLVAKYQGWGLSVPGRFSEVANMASPWGSG